MAFLPTIRAFIAAQPPALLAGLAGVVILLGAAGIVAAALTALRPGKSYLELRQRIASWWVMVALLAGALLAGWQATVVVFALISFMALREFLSLAPIRKEDRPAILAAYLILIAAYGFIAADRYMFYLVFIPVWTFLGLPFLMALLGQTRGFLTTAATFHWGLVTCVYNLGFAALLMRTPAAEHLPAGAAGLVFFLLLVTEFNDVAQYVFGKLLGRHKIAPTVSPNKTWEGFLGGWLATGLLIWFVGPVFTPLAGLGLLVVAATLPVARFPGDVTMSAVKRDIGVKDTSHAIPGHGGVLDRADSLTFTAPLYFHLLALFALQKF